MKYLGLAVVAIFALVVANMAAAGINDIANAVATAHVRGDR